MNLRNVLRAYSLLRQLSDDETVLLNILRTLNDSDREALVVSMSDKPPQKKSSKKAAGKGGSKSARASGMAAQLSSRRQEQEAAKSGIGDGVLCTAILASNGLICNTPSNYELHHDKGYVDYHEFVAPPAAHAATGD